MGETIGKRPQDQGPIETDIGEKKVNETFKPFERLRAFPPLVDEEGQRLSEVKFQFLGLNGSITVLTGPDPEDVDNLATPLGEVRVTKSFYDGRRTLEEVPLEIELSFDITTMDQFHRLEDYVMEFTLGEKQYYLKCHGTDTQRAVERQIKRTNYFQLFDAGLKDKDEMLVGRSTASVLLPYDIARLSQIEARIVEKEPFNPDFVLLGAK